MTSKMKNKKVTIALCVAPMALFLILCMAIFGMSLGGVEQEMSKNSANVIKVSSKEKTVSGADLTEKNKTAYSFNGAVQIYTKENIEIISVILALKIKSQTQINFYAVEEKNDEESQNKESKYVYKKLLKKTIEPSNDIQTSYFDLSFVPTDTIFLAIEFLENDTQSNADFDLYTISLFIKSEEETDK